MRIYAAGTLACLFVLLCAVPPAPAESAGAEPSLDAARAHYRANQFADAAAELDRLIEEHGERALLLRLKGICLLDLDRVAEALDTLERAVELAPENAASRYYLAQALATAGRIDESLRHLARVRVLAPESSYAKRAAGAEQSLRRLAGGIRTETGTKRWNLYVRTAAEYDDNVPVRSKHEEGDEDCASLRWVGSLYAEIRLLDEAGGAPLTAGLSGSAYASRHEDSDYDAWDLEVFSGGLFVRKSGQAGTVPWSGLISGDVSSTMLDGDSYSEDVDLSAGLDLQWLEGAVFRVRGSATWRDYENETEYPHWYSRDGADLSASVDQLITLMDERILLGLGYTYRHADTEGSQFRIDSNNGRIFLGADLPLELRLDVSLAYSEEDYIDYSPEPRRLDDTTVITSSLSRPLWEGTGLSLDHTYTASASTEEYAEYERNIYSLSFTISL